MAEDSYEWRMQQAHEGKARSFELWDRKNFKLVLSVRCKTPLTIDEMKRLMSLGKGKNHDRLVDQ